MATEPTDRQDGDTPTGVVFPAGVRVAALAGAALLVAGGVYLYSVRGTAILLDVAGGMAGAFCF